MPIPCPPPPSLMPPLDARVAAGDPDAWGEVVARHHHTLVATLMAWGITPARAEELAQDTWERLLLQQRRGRLSHVRLPGLAIRQAGFLARDELRRRPLVVALDRDDTLGAGDRGVLDRLLDREQLTRTRAALGRCSDRARTIFETVHVLGLSHADAAAHLGISVQRVRQTLCEVRRRLRAALEDDRGERQTRAARQPS